MNVKKHIRNTAIAMAVVISTSSTVFAANTYSDVPSTHWAYTAITKVADKGIMVGDGTNYYPNQVIDKMEASRILARVAGYNSTSGYTPNAKTTNTINLFKNAFPLKWGKINKDYENCIGYIYEKQILTIDDLNKFVVKYTDNTEKVKNLTREEMAVLLVKTINKKNEAIAYKGSYKFSDDSSIPDVSKPYIYYLKDLGVVTGDNIGNFNPSNSVTKAEMAVFLDRAVYSKTEVNSPIIPPVADNNTTTNNNTNTNNNNTTTNNNTSTDDNKNPQVMNVTSDEGKISNVYVSSNAISITNSSNQIKVYRLAPTVKIYIDGFVSTIDKLAVDMPAVVVVVNKDAIEIRAQKVTIPITGQVNGNTNSSNSSSNNNSNNSDNSSNNSNQNNNTVVDEAQLTTRVCKVAETGNINNSKTITVVVQMLNPSGDIYDEKWTYILSSKCTIKKANKDVNFADIAKGDIVTIKVSGNNVHSIVLEEKTMNIKNAELIDKRLNDDSVPILTIKTKEDVKYELKVSSTSDIRRKGEGSIKWKDLRVGDTVEVDKEYNSIVYLYAEGSTSTVEGWVKDITIAEYSSITLADAYGEKTVYRVASPSELYTIRLDSKIRVTLDSKEVDTIRVLSEGTSSTMAVTGTVDSIKYNYMYIDTNSNVASVKVSFNSSTTVYDAVSSRNATLNDISSGMYVTVTFTNTTDYIAKTVSILAK